MTTNFQQEMRDRAKSLATIAGLPLTGLNKYGCLPGWRCNCPSRLSTCSAWDRLEKAAREAQGQPEPPKRPVYNKWGQDVTGKVYNSRREAMFDLYGSTCD